MKLFRDFNDMSNLLPYDGDVQYYSNLTYHTDLTNLFRQLFEHIEWQPDVVTLFGRTITTKRKVALYADKKTTYTYSNQKKLTKPWIPELVAIKNIVETITNEQFNCCLCNLYHNGTEGMGWHSDNEKVLNPMRSIASVSFGTERYFHFKHKKTKETVKFLLENGSLLLMKPPTQDYWLHALPKSRKITSKRINLTFRSLKTI